MATLSPESVRIGNSEERKHTRTMAKADIDVFRKPDTDMGKAIAGGCIEAARLNLKRNLNEFAHRVDRDPRQVKKWETGELPAPIHLFMTMPDFWAELLWQYANVRTGGRIEAQRTLHFRVTL